MNEELKNIPEYVKNLPKAVQELVFDGVWQERTEEIAKKYSLTPAQTDTLVDKVLFILIGLEQPEMFLDGLVTELSISQLLAEQIVQDLEKRVFEYALGRVSSGEGGNANKTIGTVGATMKDQPSQTSKVPEIAPNILPAKQNTSRVEVPTPKYVPPAPAYRPVSNVPNNRQSDPKQHPTIQTENQNSRITYKPAETINQSIGNFPAGSTAPKSEPQETNPPKPNLEIQKPPNIIDTKLNSVVTGITNEKKPVHEYTTDPYREPLK